MDPIQLFADSLQMAYWPFTADIDLSSATADVFLAGAWHSLTWDGAAVQVGDKWTRTGGLLVSGANPGTGVKPTANDRVPLTRLSVNGEVIERKSVHTLVVIP